MMHAYDEQYLNDAMRNLGEAFDYAANDCKMKLDEFADIFIAGGIAEQFGSGVPKYVSGLSGTELVWDVLERSGLKRELPEAGMGYDFAPEYWCGWILAYYQWYTGRSFKNIKQHISMEEILKLYPTLHEAAEEKFVDTVNRMIRRSNPATKLQVLRKSVGYSQKALAEKSGVTLRMIQQYEQRAKDINKAAGIHLAALARTLGCQVEDLLEQSVE
ncbi:MAG: helix-turn-helix transcriptional regulator [Lachnospiraceae bacterium]|nr:helix-turn-helix transcriptional regulator [Lachnospiraceae bacterium]